MLIVGTARNIEAAWPSTQRSLNIIFNSVESYHCIIIESNSSDNTLKLLREWESPPRRVVVSLGKLDIEDRVSRLVKCRNEYMFYVDYYKEQHDHTLIIDLDDSLNICSNFKEQLRTCFTRLDWDAVASNRWGVYYDIWALRCEKLGISFDCWTEFKKERKKSKPGLCITDRVFRANSLDKFIGKYQQNIPPTSNWIPCASAFGCMALYKTKAIVGKIYDNSEGCEHVSFNRGLRMFINPRFISG